MLARHAPLDRKTLVFVVLSLLFSQLALARYLCPAVEGSLPSSAAVQMVAGMPCEGMDAQQPVLCHQHAADEAGLVQLAHAVSPTLPVVVQVLPVPAALDLDDARALPRPSLPQARPPPEPLFLATLRLRV